jgi:hypothetical protein
MRRAVGRLRVAPTIIFSVKEKCDRLGCRRAASRGQTFRLQVGVQFVPRANSSGRYQQKKDIQSEEKNKKHARCGLPGDVHRMTQFDRRGFRPAFGQSCPVGSGCRLQSIFDFRRMGSHRHLFKFSLVPISLSPMEYFHWLGRIFIAGDRYSKIAWRRTEGVEIHRAYVVRGLLMGRELMRGVKPLPPRLPRCRQAPGAGFRGWLHS